MPNLSQIVDQLQTQRKQMQQELARLDAAIAALQGLNSRAATGPTLVAGKGHRTMSAAARRRIAAAQRARWAKVKAAKPLLIGKAHVVAPRRRTMSAAARRKIAAAQRARWAAWKVKQKKAA